MTRRIAVIPGDGIGPEVIGEAVDVLAMVAESGDLDLDLVEWDLGADRFLETGVAIRDEEMAELAEEHAAILLGALGDPRVEDDAHVREILLGLRFRLDLYVNHRPVLLPEPGLSPLARVPDAGIRIDIFRENTEGAYVAMGGTFREGTPDELAIEEDVNTRKGVERITRAAFAFARERGRERVTLVDKANAMPAAGSLWRRVFAEVGGEYPELEREALFVDAAAMDLVRRPERYDVILTSNLFGDILSDLAAVITGGLGLAPSANVHPESYALFEPVHGSAPDIAGRGTANPLAAIRCVALLLDHLGHREEAEAVEDAVMETVRAGRTTPDLGGSLSTREVGSAVRERLGRPAVKEPGR